MSAPAIPAPAPSCYERPHYAIELPAPVRDRLAAMKAVRALWPDIDLKGAKALVDGAPCTLRTDVSHLDLDRVRLAFWDAQIRIEVVEDHTGRRT